jgi:hypothetical protein
VTYVQRGAQGSESSGPVGAPQAFVPFHFYPYWEDSSGIKSDSGAANDISETSEAARGDPCLRFEEGTCLKYDHTKREYASSNQKGQCGLVKRLETIIRHFPQGDVNAYVRSAGNGWWSDLETTVSSVPKSLATNFAEKAETESESALHQAEAIQQEVKSTQSGATTSIQNIGRYANAETKWCHIGPGEVGVEEFRRI